MTLLLVVKTYRHIVVMYDPFCTVNHITYSCRRGEESRSAGPSPVPRRRLPSIPQQAMNNDRGMREFRR